MTLLNSITGTIIYDLQLRGIRNEHALSPQQNLHIFNPLQALFLFLITPILFCLDVLAWQVKPILNSKEPTCALCDFNMQFEYAHYINLRTGSKIIQGMH